MPNRIFFSLLVMLTLMSVTAATSQADPSAADCATYKSSANLDRGVGYNWAAQQLEKCGV